MSEPTQTAREPGRRRSPQQTSTPRGSTTSPVSVRVAHQTRDSLARCVTVVVMPFFSPSLSDPGASLCSSSLCPPEGSIRKPQCEVNPFLPQPAMVQWAAPLTESAHSPMYLQADWLSVSVQGLDGQLVLSGVMRAPTKSKKPSGNSWFDNDRLIEHLL